MSNPGLEQDIAVLHRALERERKRRAQAEHLLEEKSRELFASFNELSNAHDSLKSNQQQLLQSEKLASLGLLSAGLAHEINNPIGFVLSNVNSLAEYAPKFDRAYRLLLELLNEIEDDSPLAARRDLITDQLDKMEIDYLAEDSHELIIETKEGIERVRQIVDGLRDFARDGAGKKSATDVAQSLSSTLVLIRSHVKSLANLSEDLQDDLVVNADSSQLGQVFMNLIMNATQAVDEKSGEIHVQAFREDTWVVVQIRDNGCGISQENQAKLFTPFFTTKPVGEGTGLGLSISYGIVRDHNGHIDVSSTEGSGTTFSVRLPAHISE